MLEFRRNAQGVLRRIAKGERLLLSHRGKPAARLEPVTSARGNVLPVRKRRLTNSTASTAIRGEQCLRDRTNITMRWCGSTKCWISRKTKRAGFGQRRSKTWLRIKDFLGC